MRLLHIMEIYPDNLGPELGAAVRQNREEQPPDVGQISFFDHPLGRVLMAAMVPLLVYCLFGPALAGVTILFGGVALVAWSFDRTLIGVKAGLRQDQSELPLMKAEVQGQIFPENNLSEQTFNRHDLLVRGYLELVKDVIQSEIAERDAQAEIRAALQTLGTTVVSLPAEEPRTERDDPARLQGEAGRLYAEADAEPDAVIGASLRRRAESLTRRADTAGKTLLLLRRNQALRQETTEQMEALQTSLTAFRVGGQPSVPELADLAAGIQRVAREANAITEARAEVGTLLATPGRLREETEPRQQSVGE